jgi:Tfp pilus assembly protein PilF
MKRILALMILLVVSPLARAAGTDDQYIAIYNLIQQGDALSERGDQESALAKYTDAQEELKAFQVNNPDWYTKVVKYRLNYLNSKISGLSAAKPVPQAPPPSPSPAPPIVAKETNHEPVKAAPATVTAAAPTPAAQAATNSNTALSTAEDQIKALQEQIRNVESDKSLLEAKLKEALAAQPAAADPRELAKAQEQINELQKQNELLNASLAQAKTNAAQGNPAALEETRKALEEANRKVAQMTEANASLTMEKQAMEARFKTLSTSADPNLAALREENQLLKKQLADIKSKDGAAPQSGDLDARLKEAQSQLAVLQSEKEMWRLEKLALQNQLKDRPPAAALVLNPGPGAPLSPEASAERIRQLEAERDELKKSLATALKLSSGSKRSREMASRITEMTKEMESLHAQIAVLEARPVPYTEEELKLFVKRDPSELVAEAVHHSARENTSREVSPKVALLLAQAKQYWVAHDLEKAEEKYLEMIKMDLKNPTLLADLASIQSDRDQVRDAEKNIQAALAINPNDDYVLFILGVVKYKEKKMDESLEAFSRAAQISPQNPQIQDYIGVLLSVKGVRGPAEAAFRKAIQIKPDFADAHAHLALAYITQKPPLVELARWHYQKALDAGHPRDLDMEKLFDQAKPAANQSAATQ